MTNIQYGLISQTDARTLEKTIDLIANDFLGETINITEIGLFDGGTTKGLQEYLSSKKLPYHYTGIDNEKDKPVNDLEFYYCKLIIGNSNEVYNALADNSQHLIIVDANHSYPYTIADFFCYCDKVKIGGFMAFHDCGKHIKLFKDYQRIGSESDYDMYISCRKALTRIGLFDNKFEGWKLVMDEADENDPAGGFAIFKRIR